MPVPHRPLIDPPATLTVALNVADRLHVSAVQNPAATAVVCPRHWSPNAAGRRRGQSGADYSTVTFAELDDAASCLASGLLAWGVPPGTRLALLVRPGIEFVALVFGLLRAGIVTVLIDPGIGRKNLVRCLSEAKPAGFIAIPRAHAARCLYRTKFRHARWNVTVGRRWCWGGLTLAQLRELGGSGNELPVTRADDPAAIIFTSGSTGPPKGVLYTHRMFNTQVAEIQSAYGIEPGGVDLSCFPLFALFNSAMGVTTVLPEMDFSRPARAEPSKLLAAARDWQVTQAFASPAVWRRVSDHCARTDMRIESLRQVFSCGAAVPADVLRSTLACVAQGARMHTPYGATECLPVATIEAAEVLAETAAATDRGAGVCVGRKFDSIDWRVIRIMDEPIATIEDAEELPVRQIGELIVRGPQASPHYVTRIDANAAAKIADGQGFWHRMGDVGYVDDDGRFWYCGRKSQRVETATGPLFTECVEAIFNTHPAVRRSALVGIGPRQRQTPVLVIEPNPRAMQRRLTEELRQLAQDHSLTCSIDHFLLHPGLPVDVRHNAKIYRELLATRAARKLQVSEFALNSADSCTRAPCASEG